MTVCGHVYPDVQPSGSLAFPAYLWLVHWHLWIAATVPSAETNNYFTVVKFKDDAGFQHSLKCSIR